MRSRLAVTASSLAASSLAAVLAVAGPTSAVVATEMSPDTPTACPDLAGTAAGATLDAQAVGTCVADAVMDQKALEVTFTGTFAGTVWVSHNGATKVLAKVGDGTRVLILPRATFVKRKGVARGLWVKKKSFTAMAQLPLLDPTSIGGDSFDVAAVLEALQPCATVTSAGSVADGVELACPADMTLELMGFTVDVAKASAVIDPATYLPVSAELDASAMGFTITEQFAFDWDRSFNWGNVRSTAAKQWKKVKKLRKARTLR